MNHSHRDRALGDISIVRRFDHAAADYRPSLFADKSLLHKAHHHHYEEMRNCAIANRWFSRETINFLLYSQEEMKIRQRAELLTFHVSDEPRWWSISIQSTNKGASRWSLCPWIPMLQWWRWSYLCRTLGLWLRPPWFEFNKFCRMWKDTLMRFRLLYCYWCY